jgi:lactosylceramide 4-alpha-galactosyltransferase
MRTSKIWSFLLGCSFTTLVWYVVETSIRLPSVEVIEVQREDRFFSIRENVESESMESDENIFFIETRIGNFHNLDSRQACSIESAGEVCAVEVVGIAMSQFCVFSARAYPNTKVFVLFLTKTDVVRLNHTSLLDALTEYDNVHLRLVNIYEFSKGTPLEAFVHSDELDKSRFQVSHTSDVLRFLTLWKFGGTYFDLDVIVKRNSSLKNFACRETERLVNGAVLNLDRKSGKQISAMLIK